MAFLGAQHAEVFFCAVGDASLSTVTSTGQAGQGGELRFQHSARLLSKSGVVQTRRLQAEPGGQLSCGGT